MISINHHASPLVADAAAVRLALGKLPVLAAMRSVFQALAQEQAVQPAQTVTVFPQGAGDFITYLGALSNEQVFGAKLSPYLVTGGLHRYGLDQSDVHADRPAIAFANLAS